MSQNIIDITDDNFNQEVLQSEKLVLADFWAPWCGPCRQLTPIIEEFASEYQNKIKVVKINVDDAIETATKMGIKSIPTLMLFKNGNKIDTKVGALQKEKLIEWTENNL